MTGAAMRGDLPEVTTTYREALEAGLASATSVKRFLER